MAGMSRCLAVLLLLSLSDAQLMRRHSSRAASRRSRLQGALREALAKVSAEQVLFVEESLRDSYEAFPKDAKGNLPPHSALPALARAYFAKEHGWLIRGLESPGAPIIAPGESYREATQGHGAGDLYEVHALQDKAPELAAALKEAALSPVASSRGMSLADISQTVAALEQILLEESVGLLRAAYVLNELENDMDRVPAPITVEDAHEVLLSYLLLFRHGLPHDLEDAKKHLQMKLRARKTSEWKGMQSFEAQALNSSGKLAWTDLKERVMLLAKLYGRWQNRECEDMKSTLVKMGDSGRVKLNDFHGSPKYPQYQFTEKEEYLQQAGILEEENGEKYVLIANYLLGASNCIASSEYFAVCCLNECETLLNHFEASFQMPGAALEQVQHLASELNASAVSELSSAADASGVVVWHSPAFRRWLHRAFPLQCPRPTALEDEAVEAELTEAKEWMEIDEAARQKLHPLVLHPSECTRLPEWHETPEESAALEV